MEEVREASSCFADTSELQEWVVSCPVASLSDANTFSAVHNASFNQIHRVGLMVWGNGVGEKIIIRAYDGCCDSTDSKT